VEDPQNLGQIIRTAECGGIDGIILPEHHSAGLTQTTMQISQGAFVHIPIYRCTNIRHQIKNLKKDGFWVYALENSIKAKPWHEIDLTGKSAIVLGSEGQGIRKLVLEECDVHATIPMSGSINSLNVSAATSAIVFERLRQTLLS
jgi:23S rRNA (guanosine2251-2'-O)-methyltransferase